MARAQSQADRRAPIVRGILDGHNGLDPSTDVLYDLRADVARLGPGVDKVRYSIALVSTSTDGVPAKPAPPCLPAPSVNAEPLEETRKLFCGAGDATNASAPEDVGVKKDKQRRLLKAQVSSEEDLCEQLEVTAGNVKSCLEKTIYAHKDPETASVVTWLKSFCGLAHKLAYQDPSEDVLQDLGAFITWFTEEL